MGRHLLRLILIIYTAALGGASAQSRDSIVANPEVENNECVVHFRINQASVDSGYMNNRQELMRLKSAVLRLFSAERCSVDSILIHVSSSLDGNFYTNQWLTNARLKSFCNYLYREFPELKHENVIITSNYENWAGLRLIVAANPQIPRRDDVLNIIDTESMPGLKKRKLRELDNGVTYTYIIRHFSHLLRYGSISAVWHSPQSDTTRTQVFAANETSNRDSILIGGVVGQEQILPAECRISNKIDTPSDLYAPLKRVQCPTATTKISDLAPKFALKTNLLYLAALCPNIEGELYVGNRWSINLEYQYAWWSNKTKHRYYRLAAISPEVRYWFASKSRFKGHFAGIYVGAGLYEFMAKPASGIQGEFFIAGGVTYGWAFPVAKWMNMELSIGVGYMMSEYRKYYHDVDCYVYNDTQRFTYFGPTKVKVSLMFPLHIKKKSERLRNCLNL